jgi:hypothetical protein
MGKLICYLMRVSVDHKVFCFGWEWGLNSGLCTCKDGTVLLELYLQAIFALIILDNGGLTNYLRGLVLNHDPPNLSLPSS